MVKKKTRHVVAKAEAPLTVLITVFLWVSYKSSFLWGCSFKNGTLFGFYKSGDDTETFIPTNNVWVWDSNNYLNHLYHSLFWLKHQAVSPSDSWHRQSGFPRVRLSPEHCLDSPAHPTSVPWPILFRKTSTAVLSLHTGGLKINSRSKFWGNLEHLQPKLIHKIQFTVIFSDTQACH